MSTLEIQRRLIALGYTLPRFGADGAMGDETRAALARFCQDRGLPPLDGRQAVPSAVIDALIGEVVQGGPLDVTTEHSGEQWRPRALRPWSSITGITLHQTAVVFGEKPQRWYTLNAHLGVTRGGRSFLICPLDRVVWHGNGLNGTDVGVELDGYYEGIEGQRRTFWTPPQDPGRVPLITTPEQIEATRQLLRWICAEVERRGGKVRYIHAHRQSSPERQSDPGSRIWSEVGLWAQRELGLSDGGRDFCVTNGLKIPEAWDPSRVGIKY